MIEDRFASAKLAVIDMGTGQGKNRKHIVKIAKKAALFSSRNCSKCTRVRREKSMRWVS
jgi:hypothetical protein